MANDTAHPPIAAPDTVSEVVVLPPATMGVGPATEDSVGHRPSFQWGAPARRSSRRTTVGIEYDGRRLLVIGAAMRGERATAINQILRTSFDEEPGAEQLAACLGATVGQRHPDVHLVLATPRAVVRHFLIPPVAARRREKAALWEGQKLIPFPLQDGQALFGFQFVSAGDRGWMVTLVAVPTEDVQPILAAVEQLRWTLRSVSVAGTQSLAPSSSSPNEEVVAVIAWSQERGSFAITHGGQLVFHYDLGPMPALPSGLAQGVSDKFLPAWQRWIDSIGVAVGDALDFHLNINASIPPTSLYIYGLRPELAPLLSEWESRFPGGVILADPLTGWREPLPDGVSEWLSMHGGLVAPVLGALSRPVAIDLTPRRIRLAHAQQKRERIARSAFVLCALIGIVWGGFLWSEIAGHRNVTLQVRAEFEQLQRSPVSSRLEYTLAGIAANQRIAQTLEQRGEPWMPWAKSVLAVLPPNAALRRFDLAYRDDRQAVVAEVDGTLAPGTAPYALTYREWFDRLRPLCAAPPLLVSEKHIGVEGAESSAFTVELIMPAARRDPGGTR
ncbi:MAG TPA: hypothetical protein VNN55_09170 [bacterium]|nr:hypothetical protein [bacterium]